MWLIKIFSAIYFTAACAAQEPQDVSSVFAEVSPTSPLPISTAIPTVYDPPVPSLKIQSIWLDVFPSEKVDINCSVEGSSDWTFTWFRNGQEVQDSDPNVSLFAEGSMLEITAATQTYAGSYTCKGHHKTKKVTTGASNSLELTVHANKPKPIVSRSSTFNKMYPRESITFTCMVDVSFGWEYMWYHDGNEIQANHSTYYIYSIDHNDSGQYHCNAKRGKGPFYTEDSTRTMLQVSDPPKPSLKLQTPWTDVFENETVGFSCEVDSIDWTITWYKNEEELQEDFFLTLDTEESLLNITSITEDYQGIYACRAHLESRRVNSEFSNTIDVTVYENIPKPTLTKDPGVNPMYVGETVNFTCSVNVSSGWEYQWYKDGELLPETSKTISIHLSNGEIYSCLATRGETTATWISEEIQQDVIEIPVPSLRVMTPWLDVFPDESVKLICGMDNSSDWMYTWFKDGQKIQDNSGPMYFSLNGPTLSINSASAPHAGQYNCKGYHKDRSVSSSSSSGLNLTIYDMKPTVTLIQDPDYKLMFQGESVSFSCHIDVSSGWEYLWYKDGKTFGVSGNKYTISTVGTTNRGSYKCRARRGTNQVFLTDTSWTKHLDVQEKKPKPSITQHPGDDMVYIGESVSFGCNVPLASGWEYLWYKDGAQLSISSSSLTISAAYLFNSTYECMARRNKTMYNTELSVRRILRISEVPVPSLKLLTPWLDVFPTESVKLSCGIGSTSEWTYTWYKGEQKVQASDTVSFDMDGRTLSISSASAFHNGRYSCAGKLKSRSVTSRLSSGLKLDVYDSKPRVMLMQNHSHNVMHTGESVSFSCHNNISSGWEYLWYKDDSSLAESGYNHTITSVLTKDSGSYKCQTKRGRNKFFYSDQSQAVRLDIKERPKADIILITGWSEVFSTDSLVLKCWVHETQYTWNYTWFKDDKPIDLPPSEKYTVTPQNDSEKSLYTCQGIRSGRPFYSKTSEHFKTKNLLLKRRVLLSISGCIFFGILAVFIGCTVLRVIRKPAEDEYKPEEADLFLSMDQLKGLDDAPCPLFQYITDAELNSPSKDGDENDVTGSETPPLPISSLEDQAVMTESNDDAENGGLVSFK